MVFEKVVHFIKVVKVDIELFTIFCYFLFEVVGPIVIYSLSFLMLVICVFFLSCLKFTILLSVQRTNCFFLSFSLIFFIWKHVFLFKFY